MAGRRIGFWGAMAALAVAACVALTLWGKACVALTLWEKGCGDPCAKQGDCASPSMGTEWTEATWQDRGQMGSRLPWTWRAGESVDTVLLGQVALDDCFAAFPLTDSLLQTMQGKSWPEGCPVDPTTLRYLHVLHYNLDGRPQMGELIVHARIADKVLQAFLTLYRIRYPIERMVLVDRYDGNDERSMADNNTSAFNFRYMTGSTTKISKHGLGLAIDINPLYNPYVKRRPDGTLYVSPEAGRPYATDRRRQDDVSSDPARPYATDRQQQDGGASRRATVPLIDASDPAYIVFTRLGFEWGGAWKSCQDYQHFEYDLGE